MDREFLKKLLETASPSGYEKNAALIWKNKAKEFADMVYGDIHGNSVAAIWTTKYGFLATKIMLAGHIDEIGFIISNINVEGGFLYFQTIGGFDPQILPGQRVKIFTKTGEAIKGCIGRTPVHLLSEEERKQAAKTENLWIDVGGKENAKSISIGDFAVIDYPPELLGGNILVARGIDDRIGAFIVLEVLRLAEKEKIQNTIYSVATVQEEIGLRGATTSAFSIEPHVGIAVDVCFATDHPHAKSERTDIKLGKGPVISIGPNITPSIHELLVQTAEESNIPYQIEAQPRGTGTDANVIQLTKRGVATGLVSIPSRYMHTPCEMVDLNDVENAIKLLARFCEKNIGQMLKTD